MASKTELEDLVQKEFETHPEGLTIDEMCEIVKKSKILKRFSMYRVMRVMIEGGAVPAPYQKYDCGRSEGGCPHPFEMSYTLPRLIDANIKAGMKSSIRAMLENGKKKSVQELKKELAFDPSDDENERFFTEALKELENSREINCVCSLSQGPEVTASESNN